MNVNPILNPNTREVVLVTVLVVIVVVVVVVVFVAKLSPCPR